MTEWKREVQHFQVFLPVTNLNLNSECIYLVKELYYTLAFLGFESSRDNRFFLLHIKSRPNLGLTQPPIKWVLGNLSLVVKWVGHAADHLLPPSAKDTS
jgi:hypothetical protein